MDEKSQTQALDRTAPCLPILPTTPLRRSAHRSVTELEDGIRRWIKEDNCR